MSWRAVAALPLGIVLAGGALLAACGDDVDVSKTVKDGPTAAGPFADSEK